MTANQSDADSQLPWEQREVDDAARDAARTGGRAGDEYLDPAERPLAEGGEGVAEGFELAEEDLIEGVETGVGRADPSANPFTSEVESREPAGEYSEADHEDSSEQPEDDR